LPRGAGGGVSGNRPISIPLERFPRGNNALAFANRTHVCEVGAMAAQPVGVSARVALRVATRSVHERLHVAPPFLALTQDRLPLADYVTLLSRMAGYYFAVSERVAIEPTRLQSLRQDLADLGSPTPPRVDLPPVEGETRSLGWRYVVEGSIFGGRVIYRQLDSLFGDEEAGRSFFRGTATGTRHWQDLCSELDDAGAAAGAIDEMIEGARDAFSAFECAIAEMELADV